MSQVIGWWSGGVTSAVACKLAIDIYGANNVDVIMMDTKNEDDDTYRFFEDCERWFGKRISIITALNENETIEDVWIGNRSLNVAHGAICSSTLKRDLRLALEKKNEWRFQVFGFDFSEFKRAKSMKSNYPQTKPIFPLLMFGYSKEIVLKLYKKLELKYHKPTSMASIIIIVLRLDVSKAVLDIGKK